MNSPRYRTLTAIVELRRRAADTVALCDLCIYGSESEARIAQSALPNRLRSLQFRVQRALTALEEGGAHG
jgi:hypothetical protein